MTKNTLNSVFKKTEGLNYEIILIDNASTDGSLEFFEKNYKDRIIFIKNNKNLGFGRANNKGIEIAKGKYVFLLNSDTILVNNAIKILFDYIEKNKKCGICGGNLYNAKMEATHSYLKKLPDIYFEINYNFNYLKKIFKRIVNKRDDFNYLSFPIEVGYITGADLFIRRELLKKLGGFDQDFFMYSEEAELTYRVKKLGYRVMSVPQAKIIHLEGKSTKFKEKKLRMFLESKYKYYYKLYSLKEVKVLYWIYKLKYIFSLKDRRAKLKINKEEYEKFLQNYKYLRKDH